MSDASENRVFISCVTGEFETADPALPFAGLRGRIRRNLARADCEVKVQEDFRQTPEDTVQKLDGYIRGCAAVLHLVGEKPGATADPKAVASYLAAEPNFLANHPDLRAALGDCSGIRYTQWEAFIALHHNRTLFVYATETGAKAQKAHLERLKLGRRYASTFGSEADLAWQLVGDLRYIIPAFGTAVQRLAKPRFLHHTAEFFLGREDELARLDTAWADGTNVLSVIAWGGVGKTALMSEWIQTRFVNKQWKDADGRPCPLAHFDWSFYDQGTRSTANENATRTGSVGDFFEQALTHFGDTAIPPTGKGKRLAEFVRRQRALFILDGLEPLQYPTGNPMAGRILDPDLRDFIELLAQSNPGLLLITSRQALTDLDGLHDIAACKHDLDDLPKPVAVRLLRKLQITGSDEELEEASEQFYCHALSLTLLGRFLFDAHGGDIRRIDRVKDLHRADTLTREERHRTAWKVLDSYSEWLKTAKADGQPRTLAVLRLLGLFDRTATAGCLGALRAEPAIAGLTDDLVSMKDDEWNILLRRLERLHLLKLRAEDGDKIGIDAHPLVREYFAEQMKTGQPEAFKAAHSRLFDFLCKNTERRPDTLDGLQPLYQAVVHGCLANRHQEACDNVYIDRILRGTEGDGFYSWKLLGAVGPDLGAVAAFFDDPWSRLSRELSEWSKSWLLNEASLRLRALGRLVEAVEPMRVSTEQVVRTENWAQAAICAGNLSELGVTLGRLGEAIDHGRRAVEYAQKGKSEFWVMGTRTATADALHQAGRRSDAAALFASAERDQAKHTPQAAMLYSLAGFRYADLILAPAEQAAWASILRRSSAGPNPDATVKSRKACDGVERRATQTLKWAVAHRWSMLTLALDHLTLARARLYRALHRPSHRPTAARRAIGWDTALAKLRASNTIDELPRGLLTAVLHAGGLIGDMAEAKKHLAEAQHIAERGPMPLHLADVHLHRARLFRDKAELKKARALIEKHGYWRRKEELEDAEAAAANWTAPLTT